MLFFFLNYCSLVLEQCEYFREALSGCNWQQQQQPAITINHAVNPDISDYPTYFSQALDLLYTGNFSKAVKDMDSALSLLSISDELTFVQLKEYCVKYIKGHIDTSNVAMVRQKAQKWKAVMDACDLHQGGTFMTVEQLSALIEEANTETVQGVCEVQFGLNDKNDRAHVTHDAVLACMDKAIQQEEEPQFSLYWLFRTSFFYVGMDVYDKWQQACVTWLSTEGENAGVLRADWKVRALVQVFMTVLFICQRMPKDKEYLTPLFEVIERNRVAENAVIEECMPEIFAEAKKAVPEPNDPDVNFDFCYL